MYRAHQYTLNFSGAGDFLPITDASAALFAAIILHRARSPARCYPCECCSTELGGKLLSSSSIMPETISLGRYLFERLHQAPIGLNSIFGVPGDFNLTLLDKIEEVDGLQWRGNANELNAAYATDGYSRVRGALGGNSSGFGALVTTFGVGELSALNGVAGAYAEHVGMIHIVGIPSTASQQKQLLLHHTLGNGNYGVFRHMSAHISQTTGIIHDESAATKEIDRCIREAYINQRPTYLAFPSNMVEVQVSADLLKTPLDLSLPKNDEGSQEEVVDRVLELIASSKNPVILVDACAARHGCTEEARKLIDLTGFKFATTPMAKGSQHISEDHKQFIGTYVGTLSYPRTKEEVESSDLVLSLGAMLSDFNTGSFSYSYQTNNVVEFHSDYTKIKKAQYPNVRMKEVLNVLLKSQTLKETLKDYKLTAPKKDPFPAVKVDPSSKLTQHYLWTALSSWLREHDTIVTETGTSSFGIVQTKFPKDAVGISQVLWGSIGYSVGATCGAVMAAEEIDPNNRVILFVGDGSLQLTVQEISSMIRYNNKPYIFILNNAGYTIEKLIHGEKAEYNNIQPWKHQQLLDAFGAEKCENIRVNTVKDLNDIFASEAFAKNDKIRVIELMLDVMDLPENLVQQAQLLAKTNA